MSEGDPDIGKNLIVISTNVEFFYYFNERYRKLFYISDIMKSNSKKEAELSKW